MGEEQFARDPFSISAYIVCKPVMRQLMSLIIRLDTDSKGNKYYDANIITSYPRPCIPAGCCCGLRNADSPLCSGLNNTYHSSDGRNSAQYSYCVISPQGFTLQNYFYGLLNKRLYRSNLPLFMSAIDKNDSFFAGKNYSHFYGGVNEMSEYSLGKKRPILTITDVHTDHLSSAYQA